MSAAQRVRFAPSPTGSLHLGNARTALFNWLVARRGGGPFVLRIEDTDTERGQQGSEEGIFEDLRWLGMLWDEGPDIGGPVGPYRQSERGEHYRSAVERLYSSGRAYRCFCAGPDLDAERDFAAPSGRGSGCPGQCREIAREVSADRAHRGEPFAVRFRIIPEHGEAGDLVVEFRDRFRGEISFPVADLPDMVLLRRDGRPTYNFAVVVDDIAMQIDLVLRGDDHLSNTPRQVLLFRALAARLPEFAHLPMVRGADGERLSKRHGATSVAEFRRLGYPPEAVLNAIALLGWAPDGERTILSVEEMVAEFDLDHVGKSAAVFDPVKFEWISGQHIHREPAERLAGEIGEALARHGRIPAVLDEAGKAWMGGVAELVRNGITRFEQAPERAAGLFLCDGIPADAEAKAVLEDPASRPVIEALAAALDAKLPESLDEWSAVKAQVKNQSGAKGKALFHPIRVALTGAASGPDLDKLVPLIEPGSRLFPDRVPSLRARLRLAMAARA